MAECVPRFTANARAIPLGQIWREARVLTIRNRRKLSISVKRSLLQFLSNRYIPYAYKFSHVSSYSSQRTFVPTIETDEVKMVPSERGRVRTSVRLANFKQSDRDPIDSSLRPPFGVWKRIKATTHEITCCRPRANDNKVTATESTSRYVTKTAARPALSVRSLSVAPVRHEYASRAFRIMIIIRLLTRLFYLSIVRYGERYSSYFEHGAVQIISEIM